MDEKEQLKNFEEYFKRSLSIDELFILEWTNAYFKTKLRRIIKFLEEGNDTPEEIAKIYLDLKELIK